jgi:hypothetical protein
MESFFERLKVYTNVPPSPTVTDELGKIMAEVLSILAIATKGIKEDELVRLPPAIQCFSLKFFQKCFSRRWRE